MEIIIDNNSSTPLYEQIMQQIKKDILTGKLQQGTILPSIRMMAKELKVSIITVKRAYEELEKEAFISIIPGKGSMVAFSNLDRLKEVQLSQLEEQLEQIVQTAKALGLTYQEIEERLRLFYEEV